MAEAILNTERKPSIQVRCSCRGQNPGCMTCDGTGEITRRSCMRCGGTGKEPGNIRCLDCRGDGWRDVELI